MTINTGGAAMIDYLCEITEPVYEYTRKPLRKDKRRLPEHMLKKRLSWVRGSMMTLIHTMKCINGFYGKRGASCRVKHCDDIKRAIEHMPFCTMDRWCITQYCIATKTIVHHWRKVIASGPSSYLACSTVETIALFTLIDICSNGESENKREQLMRKIFNEPKIQSEIEEKPFRSCMDFLNEVNQLIANPTTVAEADHTPEGEDPFLQTSYTSFGFMGNFNYGKK
ncbi:Oidioi.mRNA.OKI2018_I69.chr2.g7638.t1.cds [Oikopleura dioica]|uniref:Oidioi.mRNA.OKI2018_I69.chr2.g7638.t1.cds n=1 Tax=Oikopleura dioica TaxID=34765 RepID=A0ABN7TDD9_OIKDI|nr:Oidioi.mRNA.OKI2018_I69.chr2.g7638.t1.cds [Oikopleura dioica]